MSSKRPSISILKSYLLISSGILVTASNLAATSFTLSNIAPKFKELLGFAPFKILYLITFFSSAKHSNSHFNILKILSNAFPIASTKESTDPASEETLLKALITPLNTPCTNPATCPKSCPRNPPIKFSTKQFTVFTNFWKKAVRA